MRSLLLTFVFAYLMFLGFSFPFIAGLGYVWADILKPQSIAYSIINNVPISFIAAIFVVSLYFLKDRKHAPNFTLVMFLILFFACWITLTTFMSDLPELPKHKWDWALKVLIFALIIPYIFRTRVQIEALLLIIIFSVSTVIFSAAVKTALGSGGYGVLAVLGGESNNSGLSESSTLAAISVMILPLIEYMRYNSLIFKTSKPVRLLFLGLMACVLLTVIGTSARTGVIAMAVLLLRYIIRSKRKYVWVGLILASLVVLQSIDLQSTSWGQRMNTIQTYDQDSSAMGRIKVWAWTIEYASEHPIGGGFNSFRFNRIKTVTDEGIIYYPDYMYHGKAFHSIYFEVLGEQGFVGFTVYMLILILTWRGLSNIAKQGKRDEGLGWAYELSIRLKDALLIFMVGGAFIGIAYQPYVFYVIAITVSLEQYLRRYMKIKQTNVAAM